MIFLEFLFALFVLYLTTQQLLPAFLPTQFEKNWFFKRSKPIDEEVDAISTKKEALNNQIDEAKAKIDAEAEKVRKAEEQLKSLNN